MYPDFLHHITLNTGHSRLSYHSEVDKRLYFSLNRIVRESKSAAGARLDMVNPKFFLQTTTEEDCYVGTVFYQTTNRKVPILLTAGARSAESGVKLWKELHELDFISKMLLTTRHQLQPVPFVADIVIGHAASAISPGELSDFFEWSADFTRCMGWIYLYPEVFTGSL